MRGIAIRRRRLCVDDCLVPWWAEVASERQCHDTLWRHLICGCDHAARSGSHTADTPEPSYPAGHLTVTCPSPSAVSGKDTCTASVLRPLDSLTVKLNSSRGQRLRVHTPSACACAYLLSHPEPPHSRVMLPTNPDGHATVTTATVRFVGTSVLRIAQRR
jgi:hypothetical protein